MTSFNEAEERLQLGDHEEEPPLVIVDDQITKLHQNLDHNMHIHVRPYHQEQSLNLSGRQTAIGDGTNLCVTEAGEPVEKIGDEFILPSARRNIEILWKWLTKRKKVIAIQGEAGMGKTWTARQLLHRAVAEKLFEACIWFGKPDIHESYTLIHIRKKVSKILMKKNILLIVDDIPTFYEIIEGLIYNKREYTLLLSCEEDEALRAHKVLRLEKLSQSEAWLLFQKVAGKEMVSKIECADVSGLFQPLLLMCEGVPSKIVNVAGCLKNFLSESSSSSIRLRLPLLTYLSKSLDMFGKEAVNGPEEVKDITTAGDKSDDQFRKRFILPSTRENIKTVWEWLQDDHVEDILILAEAGMGKTWISRYLMDRAVATSQFDICIWVSAKNTDEAQIQILDQLNLTHNVHQRRNIYKSLVDKHFLLIIDGYGSYSLKSCGVPLREECVKPYKVLGTIESEENISLTDKDKILKLKKLSDDDAWLLFSKSTGTELLIEFDSRNAQKFLLPFLRRCEGVPLKIDVLAGNFRSFASKSAYPCSHLRPKQLAKSWSAHADVLYEILNSFAKQHAAEVEDVNEMGIAGLFGEPVGLFGSSSILPSNRENIKTLWEWLHDDQVEIIAIQAEAGMGKTWVARHLMDRAVAANLFDVCVWVSAKDKEEASLQILNQLNLIHDGSPKSVTSESLKSLKNKDVLLILDRFSNPRLLQEIRQYCGKRYKVVVNFGIEGDITCYADITCYVHKVLKLKKLPDDEAWELLRKITGTELLVESDFWHARELFQFLLRQCDGVPLKIVELAESLRTFASESSYSSSHFRPKQLANLWNAHDNILYEIMKSDAGQFGNSFILPSTRENIRTLWEWLHDDHVERILIQAEDGMGKTWITRQLIDRAVAADLYDICIWVDTKGTHKPRLQILDQLKLAHGWDERSNIYDALEKKHFLIVIDGYYKSKFLSHWGIPAREDCVKPYKELGIIGMDDKIIFDDNVKVLKLEKLSEGEAWLLFTNLTGGKLLEDHDLRHARELFQFLLLHCEGVPLKIIKLAESLRNFASEYSYSRVLYEILKSSTKRHATETEKDDDIASDDKPDGLVRDISHLPSAVKSHEKLWKWINDERVGTIAIQGQVGVGKTWTARQLMDRATTIGLFDIRIWLEVQDVDEAQMQIMDQLNLSNQEDCQRIIYNTLVEKHFLLIVDGNSSFNLKDVGVPHHTEWSKPSKVVVSILNREDFEGDENLYMKKLSTEEAWLFFQSLIGNELLLEIDSTHARCLLQPFLDKCDGLPRDIINLVGILKNLASESSASSSNLRLLLLAKLWEEYGAVVPKKLFGLQSLCEMLPNNDMKVCFLLCSFYPSNFQFSTKQVITIWMKSGFLDGFDSFEKAYEKGHNILKELIAHHLFTNTIFEEDDNMLMNVRTELVNEAFEYVPSCGIDVDFLVKCTTGAGNHFERRPRQISLSNGNMDLWYPTRGCSDKESLTFLLYGNGGCPPDILPDGFFEEMPNLEDVSLLHVGFKTLPTSISVLSNLRVLVVRGCDSLEDATQLNGLRHLEILCLSGASSLKEIPDDFFNDMGALENLDLSNTQIQQLPSSFSKLRNIQFLVLKGCSNFGTLPSMEDFYHLLLLDLSGTLVDRLPSAQNLLELEYLVLRGCSRIETVPHPHAFPRLKLLDLSGASSFREFQGKASGTASSLLRLDLSETQIVRLPPLSRCVKLCEIILKNCPNLETVPPLRAELEVLDLSGATLFENLQADSLGGGLLNLDLSRTRIRVFPKLLAVPSLLVQLLLRECNCLEELPELEFKKLQVLDLSGSVNFSSFKDSSFRKLRSLRTLDLSETQVVELPTLSCCSHLQEIILRGCLKLEILPQLKMLQKLEVLDVSGATAFKQFQDDSFGEKEHLRELNLSATQVGQVPNLSGCHNLCKLLLRDCSQLQLLPNLEELAKLQVLDISGAACAISLHDHSFENKYDLQILDFSGTQIVELPSLSNCTKLSTLLLPDCKKLVTMPNLNELTNLEVLDLSGDTSFAQFQHEILEHNYSLQKLDLSGTKVTEFSFFPMYKNLCQVSLRGCSNLETLSFHGMFNLQKLDLSESPIEMLSPTVSKLTNLRQLLLKDCSRLTFLPHLKELTKLEVLDLSGDTSFSQFENETLESGCALQTLDLSGTKVTNFSLFSTCKNLCWLSLRGFSNLETLSFEELPSLHTLDLSDSPIEILSPSVSKLHNLRQLFLRGCSRLRLPPHLLNLAELKVLDLSCTDTEFPAGISKWIHLWYLGVMNRKFLWSFDWKLSGEITEELNLELCDVDGFGKSCLHVTASSTHIFLSLQKSLELWGKCIEKFHFCLCSTEEWGREKDIYLQEKGFVFKNIYYQTNNIPQLIDEPDKFLKICGFHAFPRGIELVLIHVEVLYLKKNDFITRLSDLGAGHVKVMRECWVERCNKVETLFHEEETEANLALGRCLEILWASNLSYLECLFGGEMPSGSFSCLKHIYIDCCPRLTSVFSSYLKLNTLETLEIKFCDQLVSIFRDQTVSGEETLPRLKTIVLCKLPKLQSICRGVLPSLELLRVKGCPELQEIPASGNSNIYREKIKD